MFSSNTKSKGTLTLWATATNSKESTNVTYFENLATFVLTIAIWASNFRVHFNRNIYFVDRIL